MQDDELRIPVYDTHESMAAFIPPCGNSIEQRDFSSKR